MKTKEQVIAHLKENGYTKKALCKILGFLIGAGLKEENEEFYVKTSGDLKWNDFWSWWVTEEEEPDAEDILLSILEDIADRYSETNDENKKKRYEAQISWLIEEFGVEYEEDDDLE